MDSRERLAENEALFRSLNANSVRRVDRAADEAAVHPFVCECSRYDCFGELMLDLRDYERVRSEPTWFLLLPGHEVEGIEQVVESSPGFTIVAKSGVAGEIVRERALEDPKPP